MACTTTKWSAITNRRFIASPSRLPPGSAGWMWPSRDTRRVSRLVAGDLLAGLSEGQGERKARVAQPYDVHSHVVPHCSPAYPGPDNALPQAAYPTAIHD